VKDEASGKIYYWNTTTDETTALGEPRPAAPSVQQQAGQPEAAPGLGRVMAEGMAFGVGSAVANQVVGSAMGSMFGGSDSSSNDSGGGGDDDYDL
jgi:hypothetical protein